MEILIPITLFAMIAAIIVLPSYFKSQERQKMAETLRAAIERGQPLPTEVVEVMTSNVRPPAQPPSSERDMRRGVIWLAVAGGLVALGLISGLQEPDSTYWLIGIAAFPGFIGAAFLILGLMNRPKS